MEMMRPLLVVIAIGAGIGLLVPTGESNAPASKAKAEATAPDSRTEPEPGWRPPAVETRLQRGPSGHFYATASVNGVETEFIVDTGASTVALTMDDARRIGIAVDPSRFTIVGTGASGPVHGQVVQIDRISLDGKEVTGLRALVLEGLGVSLLGQSYLSRISGVTMTGDEMILR
jgi:aspartyl protease family protein